MRKIELKTVETETGAKLNYSELCGACLRARAPQGFSVEEMRARLEAIKEFPSPAVDAEGKPDFSSLPDEITVSEETARELLRCIATFRWGVLDQAIVDFVDYIKDVCGNKKEDKKEEKPEKE